MLKIYRFQVSSFIASACLLVTVLFLSGAGYPSFDNNITAYSKPVPDSQESNAGSGITSKNIIPVDSVVLPEDHEVTINDPGPPARATDNSSGIKLAQAESSVSSSDEPTAVQNSSVSTLGTGSVTAVSNISTLSGETIKPVQITPAGNTGSATASIPIIAPPGRKGIGPNLSLNYNSNTRNGWLGVGWSLDTGTIRRNTKRGVNYNGNDYVFTINGSSSELVPRDDWGTNYFGAKIEGGFSKYYKNPFGGWIVTTKDGTKFFYGTTSASRQDNIHGIFKWCLDRVEDTNGNYMEIYYTRDQVNGEIYLDEIKYTGNSAGLSPGNSIKFLPDLTPRTDKPAMYTTNSAVKTTERLGVIEVYGNGQLTGRYELQYQYSFNTGRSLLSSITQFGSEGSELPSTTFVYSSSNNSFSYGNWSQNYFGISPYNTFRVGDFNGDGKRDAAFSFSFDYDQCRNECQQNCEPDCTYTCESSCENSCEDSSYDCQNDCRYSCNDYCEDDVCTDDYVCDSACQSEEHYDLCFEDCIENPYQFINDCRNNCEPSCMDSCEDSCWDAYQSCADSCTDICEDPCRQSCDDSCDQTCWSSCGDYCYYYGTDDNTWVGISGNNGLTYSSWHQTGLDIEPYVPLAGDFNGDGRSDIVFYDSRTWVGISNGSGFNFSIWSQINFGINPYNAIAVGDFNGDGLSDVVFYYEDGNTWVGISTGNGFNFSIWNQTGFGTQPYKAFRIGDFNADGLSDVAFYYENGNTWVGLSNGSSFTYSVWSQNGFGTQPYETFSVGDFNGDGLNDVAFYYENGNTWVGMSTGSSFNYSVWSNNGFGTGPYETFRVDDFNGDGLSDVVFYYEDGNTWVGISNGAGFTYSVWSQNGFGTKPYEAFGTGDFNGDGKSDVVFYYEDGNTWGGLSDPSSVNSVPDLLSSISNGIGGNTGIGYKPSSTYINTLLPFVVQTVSSVTVYDGRETSSLTTYDYDGGYYDAQEKEFRGFQYIKATATNGTTTETWFKQDDIFKGLPYDQIIKNSSGNIYTETYNTFLSIPSYTGVNFPYLSRKDDYLYDGATTPRQAIIEFWYDNYANITRKYFHGNLSVTGDERDEYTEYTYDTTTWIVSHPNHTYVIDSGGVTKTQAWFAYYPDTGNLRTKTSWLDGGTNLVTTYTYDNYGNVETITDPNNNPPTVTTYDAFTHTHPVTIQNPLGHTIQMTYDYRFGKTLTETDPNGNLTTYDYDEFGRIKKVIKPAPYGATEYFYNNFGDVNNQHLREEAQDSLGNIMKWKETYFDGLGRTITEKSGGPSARTIIVNTGYNNKGLIYNKSNPYYEGDPVYETTYTYDPADRVIYTLNPDGTASSMAYDRGRTMYIDANNHKKVAERNIYDKISKIEEYIGNSPSTYVLYSTTFYDYDTLDNLVYIKDEYGHETYITYDSLSRKIAMDDPDMGYWTYEYDADNNLTAQTDAKSQRIELEYDALNRVTKKNYPDGSYIEYGYDESFSSNSIGRLTTLEGNSAMTVFFYDVMGQVVQTTKIMDSGNYTTLTQYDDLGRVITIFYPGEDEMAFYRYDGNGNIETVLSLWQRYVTYNSYNAAGNPLSVTYENGVSTTYQYYPENNRLYSITTSNQTGGLMNLEYHYDNAGSITKIRDYLDATRTRDYKYDDLDRLIEADSPSYGGKLIYQYDKIGNMTYNCRYGYYEYDYPQPHAVKRIVKNGQVIDTYTYDDNGNMISGAGRILTYDYDDRPTSIAYNGNAVISVYDSDGQRVKKVTPNSTTIYIGNLYECTNGLCTKHIMAGAQIIASIKDPDIYYYHTDHLGSSSTMTDYTGGKVEDIYYYPFGEIKTNTGTIDVKHKFTGKEFDADIGLYYFGARYYDPRLARFISADTIVPDYTDPQSLNRYSYVLNNPLNLIDPSGNYWEETNKGYQEYVGPSIEENADRDAFLSEMSYRYNSDLEFSKPRFIPILRMGRERLMSIIKNTPAIFPISDNPNAASSPPWYQLGFMSDVNKYDSFIQKSAELYRVDPDLVRTIMYLETTHGWYDNFFAPIDMNASILPMNVQTPMWNTLGTNREALKNPQTNVDIGVKLISRIQERVIDSTPAKVGTLYNSLAKERVSDYGGRIDYYLSTKPWIK